MKKLLLVSASLFVALCGVLAQPTVTKHTEPFAVKDGQKLDLDLYYYNLEEEQPCVIFMFGGAFARGTRDRDDYIPYFHYLVGLGYKVVSIDYRLGLKDIAEVDDLTDEVAAGMLVNAIRMAVDDLLDGTDYVIGKAAEWGIDPRTIVTHGSSAGAVTVLQAEYELANGGHKGRLPKDFRYAGVMAFAGAVLTLDGGFSFASMPVPMLLMHGDADRQVPYDVLTLDQTGFYGSRYISGVLTAMGVPHYFYSFENYSHEVSSMPIREHWEEIGSFLTHLVEWKQPMTIRAVVTNDERPEVDNKDYTIADFLNGNYGL